MRKSISIFAAILLFINCSSNNDDSIEEIDVITLPVITTITVSDIEAKSAISGGNIQDDGGGTIVSKGICWSNETTPTINDNKTNEGNGNSSFSSLIIDVEPNSKYYVRAYATNEKGTVYGNEIVFRTTHFTYQGNVNLKTQSEVDEFGANGYTKIAGGLRIGETRKPSDIFSLCSLIDLVEIEEVLLIEGFSQFTNLCGLENLTSIGALYITTSQIKNLDELINITFMNGGTSGGLISAIIGNENLISINGLKNVTTINSLLHIGYNPLLNNLDGLISLNSIGSLQITRNENLVNLNGLINLSSIRTNLTIEENYLLEDINGLNNITHIGNKCEILDNTVLKDFCVFESIISNSDDFEFILSDNLYNPTKQNVIDGNCSQ